LKTRLQKLVDMSTATVVASQDSGINRFVLRQVISGAEDFGFDKIQAAIVDGLKSVHLLD
jgi:hypothetical protein